SSARPTTKYRLHWLMAADACRRADWEKARAAAAEMLAIAEQCRHEPFRSEAEWLRAKIRALSEPEAALPELRELRADCGQEEEQRYGRILAVLAAAASESGAWEEAGGVAEELVSHAASVVEAERHGWIHQSLLILTESALYRDQPGEALQWLSAIEADEMP